MPKIPHSYQLPLGLSVGFHILLILFLFIQLPATSYRLPGKTGSKRIVQANAVSAAAVSKAVKQIQHREQRSRRREEAKLRELRRQAAAARRRRIREQKRMAALQARQKKVAAKRKAEAKARAKTRAKAKVLAAKRKREQAAKARALAAKRARQKKLATEQAKLQQQLLSEQLKNEKQQLSTAQAAAKAQQIQGIVDRYKAKILNAIAQYWVIPGGTNKQLKSLFLVQVAPGGVVLKVALLKSSGDAALDQSAKVAIYKASPLPVPQNPAAFDKFRQLRLTMSPQEVTAPSA